jgi:hypothetical protein
MLKRILIAVGVIVGIFLLFKYCDFKKNEDQDITYNTINSTTNSQRRKLVVTEGHFSEVITYKKISILDGYAFFEKKRW